MGGSFAPPSFLKDRKHAVLLKEARLNPQMFKTPHERTVLSYATMNVFKHRLIQDDLISSR